MDKYKDIINLPHKQSSKRTHMSLLDRAAQFAPFAALAGYDDAIHETGRLTDEKIELSDETLSVLNRKFLFLSDRIAEKNEVTFCYFVPDKTKDGGAYEMKHGMVKKIDDFERIITLFDGTKIPMDNVLSMEGEVFVSIEAIL